MNAENRKEVSRDLRTRQELRSKLACKCVALRFELGNLSDCRALRGDVFHRGIRNTIVQRYAVAKAPAAQFNQARSVVVWQRLEQNSVDGAEDGSVRANSEGEG